MINFIELHLTAQVESVGHAVERANAVFEIKLHAYPISTGSSDSAEFVYAEVHGSPT